MKKAYFLTILLLFFTLSAHAENLLKNPDFQSQKDGLPQSWVTGSYNKTEDVQFEIIPSENALKISAAQDNHAYAIQEITVEPQKIYRFSAKIKTEGVPEKKNGAMLALYYNTRYSNEVYGTSGGWQEVDLYFTSDTKKVPVMLSLGGYSAINHGTAYFKEVEVSQVSAAPEGTQVYKYTPAKTSSPQKTSSRRVLDPAWYGLICLLAVMIGVSLFFIYRKRK